METVIALQTEVFIICCALGFFSGIIYDCLFYGRDRHGENIKSVIFWTVLTAVFMKLLHFRASGVLRWYMPGGMILGAIIYFCGFSALLRSIFSKTAAALGRFKEKHAKFL